MTRIQKRNSLLLILTALIWGVAFVAQSEGGDAVGPFSFNSIRCVIGAFGLMIAIKILDRFNITHKPESDADKKTLIKAGILCGMILTFASNFQQLGINLGSGAGKSGFLTACYILIVPIIGIFFGKKCSFRIWIGVIIALIGLYLLCIKESLTLQFSDILVLVCAVLYSFHILTVDHYSTAVDGIRLSCIQLLTCGILTSIPAILFEMKPWTGNIGAWSESLTIPGTWVTILYAGLLSCGVAYTLQIVGQQHMNPTIASMLMSLESVFAVLAGWLILREHMSIKELLGCLLIFIAIIIAQLPDKVTIE